MTAAVTNAAGYRVLVPGEQCRTTALVLAALVDEWTGAQPMSVTARAHDPHIEAHVTGGTLVLTGLPRLALANLAVAPAELSVDLLREGRLAQRVNLVVPMGAVLPYRAPAIALTATRIRLCGRVTAADFPYAAIPGARVTVGGVGTELVALSVPLALDHPNGTAMRGRALTPGSSTTLLAPARSGDRFLTVAGTAGIVSATVLSLGEDLLVAEGTNGQLVLLRTPVAVSAPIGATLTSQVLGAPGPSVSLQRAALRGDGLLPVTGMIGAQSVEIVDGGATEYRRTVVTTDSDGRWLLSGVRGIPEVTLTTSAAGLLNDGPRRCPLAPVDPFVRNVALRT